MALLLNQQSVKMITTEAVIRAAAKSWQEVDEMSGKSRPGYFQEGPQEEYFQEECFQEECFQEESFREDSYGEERLLGMTKTSLKTIKLLLSKFDPEYKLREDTLVPTVGGKAVYLMLQLLDEKPVVLRDDGSFSVDGTLIEKSGITSKGLASCISHDLSLKSKLEVNWRAMWQNGMIPNTAMALAAANETFGRDIIVALVRDDDSWLSNETLVLQMLDAAASSGNVEVLHYIFERSDTDESAREPFFAISSLCNAAKQGDEETVTSLLARKVKSDSLDPRGRTPLWQACVRGHMDVARCLLETGAINIEQSDEWNRTVLHWAAALNHDRIVRLLLRLGANSTKVDRMGLTSLRLARRWETRQTRDLLERVEMGEELD